MTSCGMGTTVTCVMTVVVTFGGEAVAANKLVFTARTKLDSKRGCEGVRPAGDDTTALDDNGLTAMVEAAGEDTNLELLAATAVTVLPWLPNMEPES